MRDTKRPQSKGEISKVSPDFLSWKFGLAVSAAIGGMEKPGRPLNQIDRNIFRK
jgi:hypothetical protein